ncbi:hypothetical protein ACWDSJ_13875 [Nocardia sp. NPDC003482]
MSADESLHDPADLLDELDAIIREQELLRQRAIALAARYRALKPHGERFDKPGPVVGVPEEFGRVNVDFAAQDVQEAAKEMVYVSRWFGLAHNYAALVREYPRPEREQADRAQVEERVRAGYQRIARSNALADYRPDRGQVDRGEADRGER